MTRLSRPLVCSLALAAPVLSGGFWATASPASEPIQAPVLTSGAVGATLPQPVASATINPWASIAAPSLGPSNSIGGYSAGCIGGAAVLPRRGRGFRVMHPDRQRRFGHRVLIQFLKDLGRHIAASGALPLAVGDLSMPRGGPTPSGHASHQSGLDVDIAYGGATTTNPTASLVDETRNAVNRRWNRRILGMLRRAASDPRVARVFVHPAIKLAACNATRGWRAEKRAWLRSLRPWWGHDGHFHVRLSCPAGNDECVSQPAIPDGDGCSELSWWLDPARAEERATQRGDYRGRVGSRPDLPKACDAVLAREGAS